MLSVKLFLSFIPSTLLTINTSSITLNISKFDTSNFSTILIYYLNITKVIK